MKLALFGKLMKGWGSLKINVLESKVNQIYYKPAGSHKQIIYDRQNRKQSGTNIFRRKVSPRAISSVIKVYLDSHCDITKSYSIQSKIMNHLDGVFSAIYFIIFLDLKVYSSEHLYFLNIQVSQSRCYCFHN